MPSGTSIALIFTTLMSSVSRDVENAENAENARQYGRGMLSVQGFDHLVIRCADVATTLAWYVERLGLAPVRVDEWRVGEAPFPSVRVDAGTIIDLIPAAGPTPADRPDRLDRLDHICLVVDARSLQTVLDDPAFDVVDGPGPRYGARGVATSVYVKDPDGLVVELRTYPD
jgi:catechol 2,3-dioxygenase-like lactoylglutathione lyase family enzyme